MPSSEGLPRKDAGLHPTRAVLVCAEPLCYRGAFPNGDPQVPARDGCSLFQKAFVASDARRRGQVCIVEGAKTIAFGAELPTPAMLASVDNSLAFRLMPDT
ncbi:hypothetical protein D5046_02085 [Verminephrobacter eiseniae]|uniref:hypothetical protein n=1 Tax=Verminephrobacter eiseniae TaxID=364317 RepID=UPI0022389115|nr:hypothetical protein [Verminephrobacter eiseniae]MCW5230172.1 hypothetical protein [Verminephrobacter eiseniae]